MFVTCCHNLSSMRCKVERRVKPLVLHAISPGSEVPNVGSCSSSTSEVQAKGLKVERSINAKHFFGDCWILNDAKPQKIYYINLIYMIRVWDIVAIYKCTLP